MSVLQGAELRWTEAGPSAGPGKAREACAGQDWTSTPCSEACVLIEFASFIPAHIFITPAPRHTPESPQF